MASVIPDGRGETFDPGGISGIATAAPAWPPADGTSPASETASDPPAATQHRTTARSPNVLTDRQIASIKQRLKLTAEQEQLWPPVEAALRKIVYTGTAMHPRRGGSPMAYIDPTSPEVRELKSAALPLLMRLSDEQKRQVKMLAYVMGLEAVASKL